MKSTKPLTVKTSLKISDELLIHPNEGFDLGLMNTKTTTKIFANVPVDVFNTGDKDFISGNLVLSNNCNHYEIQMSHKYWKKIGSPNKVVLFFDDNKVLISNENK